MTDVLILSPFFSPNVGGVETHLDDLVEVLKTQSFKSYVLTYQPLMSDIKAPSIESKGNVEIHRVEWFRKFFYKLEPYPLLDFLYLTPRLFLATIFFLVRHPKVKVIHAQGINAACIAIILKPIFKTKVIISTHAVYEFKGETFFAKITREIFSRADKIFSLLEHSKRELIKLGLPASKIEPYTYWIDQTNFTLQDKLTAKAKLSWPTDKFHLLFIGRIFDKKGINELLDSAPLLQQKDQSIQVHIIGTGPLEAKVEESARVHSNLTFHGKVPNNELAKFDQAADCLIVPSTHEEGAGRVIMEALSCGTPVLGSNRGGIPEILNSSVGALFDVTPQNIADEVLKIKSRIQNRELTTESCRQYAQAKFSAKNAQPILESYQS